MPLIKVMMITLVIINGAALSVYLSLIFSLKEENIFTHFWQILHYCVIVFYKIINNQKKERYHHAV